MSTTMIVNRLNDWFIYEDIYNDPFYLAISLLEKLNKRQKRGLFYNRISLLSNISNQKNQKIFKSIDEAIILLTSRSLIEVISKDNSADTFLFITDKGKEVLNVFREEYSHVSKKVKGKREIRTRTRV